MHLRSSISLAKTKALVKSLMNRTELLLHVTIAPHCRSLTSTPAGTPGPGTYHLFIRLLISCQVNLGGGVGRVKIRDLFLQVSCCRTLTVLKYP